ncbi:stemmadenine O-acetyltransferase-like [Tripterygium wilfordii]|nr:stemmadenine O-acetyltransferase-like [Tripterygium wilfordii]
MANLCVEIISRETIKPSSPNVHKLDPFKISYLDQLTPTTFVPLIFFYTRDGVNPVNTSETLTRLKKSLSETLDIYYPFSGRNRDNIVVNSFQEGVPFFVAKTNYRMVEFLRTRETESLNKFVPCQPFDKEKDMGVPIVSFQVNIFACGGMAIGMCFSHKHGDGTTFASFFKTWAALSRGSSLDKAMYANLGNASTVFSPRNPLPQAYTTLMETLWFSERKLVTRRFVFDAKSITTLRDKAKGTTEQDQSLPSRIEAITSFIWKCYMAASRTTLGTTKASLLVQAVNVRPRSMSNLLDGAIGNLFWWGAALANPADSELNHLVGKMREGVSLFDDDYLKSLQGEEGFEAMSNLLDQLEEIISIEKPDVLAFTSWCYQGVYELNFGFAEPVWVAVMGKAGVEFRNLVVFFETKWGKGIEAWITLDEMRMAALEQDPEFLAFASPNPVISSL